MISCGCLIALLLSQGSQHPRLTDLRKNVSLNSSLNKLSILCYSLPSLLFMSLDKDISYNKICRSLKFHWDWISILNIHILLFQETVVARNPDTEASRTNKILKSSAYIDFFLQPSAIQAKRRYYQAPSPGR